MPLGNCSLLSCNFSKSPTPSIYFFEFFVIVATVIFLPLLARYQKKLFARYAIILIGVFIFEFFTQPLWHNYNLSPWAYVYFDVSWILTFGWTGIITLAVLLVDYFGKNFTERIKFFFYVGLASALGFFAEAWVLKIGIRSYSPEVQNTVSGFTIPILGVPIEAFYYIPVFMSLIIAFYKYWELYLVQRAIIPVNKKKWLRNFVIAVLGVFLYEVMIEPMVINASLPRWSYIFHDISILLTLSWVVIIYASTTVVDYFMVGADLFKRFIAYLALLTVITIPLENILVAWGVRQYGESLRGNFIGITIPGTSLAVEVLFAIPLYLALVIAFIRYWEIVFDNKF